MTIFHRHVKLPKGSAGTLRSQAVLINIWARHSRFCGCALEFGPTGGSHNVRYTIYIYIYIHITHTHTYIYSSICWYQTDSNSISKNSVFWRKKGDAESDPGLETDGKANSQSLGIAATTWHGGETWEGKLMVSVWAFSAQIGIYMIYTTCMHIYIY